MKVLIGTHRKYPRHFTVEHTLEDKKRVERVLGCYSFEIAWISLANTCQLFLNHELEGIKKELEKEGFEVEISRRAKNQSITFNN
jgi:hypothetical protein